MTKFYLIRHAERSGDQDMLAGRMPGLALTARGRAQADALARHLAAEPIAHIFSSPLERARQTAAHLARPFGLTVGVSAEIGEVDCGAWTGRTFRELAAGDVEWRNFNRVRSLAHIPRGERANEVQGRFVQALLRWHGQIPGEGIALVSHSDPIKFVLAYFLGMPLDFHDRLEIGIGSVSVVELGDDNARVLRINETPATSSHGRAASPAEPGAARPAGA